MIYVHFTEPPLIYVSGYGGSVGGSKGVLIGLQSRGGDRRACTCLPHRQIGSFFQFVTVLLYEKIGFSNRDYYGTANGRSSLSAVWCVYFALDVDVISNLVHMLRDEWLCITC